MNPTKSAPPAPRAQRSDAARNREAIILAAREVLAEEGLDAQMDEVAARAKVGVGTVYRHFPNKLAMVEALAQARFETLAELAHKALAVEDPWEAFVGFMQASAEIQATDRSLSEVMTSRPEMMGEAAERVQLLSLVEKVMERAKGSGDLRKDAVATDVPMLMCSLATAANLPHMSWERYLGIAIDGMRAPGTSKLPPPPN